MTVITFPLYVNSVERTHDNDTLKRSSRHFQTAHASLLFKSPAYLIRLDLNRSRQMVALSATAHGSVHQFCDFCQVVGRKLTSMTVYGQHVLRQ